MAVSESNMCVKVNFDVVFHASAKTSCAGIVIRDHLGMVMGPQSVVTYLRLLLQRPWLAIMDSTGSGAGVA